MMNFTPNSNLSELDKNSALSFSSYSLQSTYFLYIFCFQSFCTFLFKSVFFSPSIPKPYLYTNYPGNFCQLIGKFNLFIFTLITLILELKSAELFHILQFPCFLLVFVLSFYIFTWCLKVKHFFLFFQRFFLSYFHSVFNYFLLALQKTDQQLCH